MPWAGTYSSASWRPATAPAPPGAASTRRVSTAPWEALPLPPRCSNSTRRMCRWRSASARLALAVGIDSFSDATRFTPAVDEALTKVSLRHNPAIGRGANAIVTMKDGRVLQGECRDFRGSIRNPMTRDEHYVKYRDCAKRVLSPEDIDRVRD